MNKLVKINKYSVTVYLESSNYFFSMNSTVFLGNIATVKKNIIKVGNLKFKLISSKRGSAVFLQNSNFWITIDKCLFKDNFAKEVGKLCF